MEQVALNNVQLDYLAREDEALKPYFHGTVACDRLPKKPVEILAVTLSTRILATNQVVCEVMDSYVYL